MKVLSRRVLTKDRIIVCGIGYLLVFLFGMCCVLPFMIVVSSSFASEHSIMANGYTLIPSEFSLNAYRWVFKNPARILRAYTNTICVTLIGTFISLLMVTMAAYVLSRKDFKWRNGFSFYFFFTTLFNGGLVPWYIMCRSYLGFKNSYLALLLPLLFSVWNLIVSKNFMKSLPYEITESGKVDGANDIVIFFRLILPLSKPLLATIGLFVALAYWNDWYNSLLFITKDEKKSLQYFLQEMLLSAKALKDLASSGDRNTNILTAELPTEGMKMAMTCVVTGPIILLYPFVQRFFVKGLTIGAVKG